LDYHAEESNGELPYVEELIDRLKLFLDILNSSEKSLKSAGGRPPDIYMHYLIFNLLMPYKRVGKGSSYGERPVAFIQCACAIIGARLHARGLKVAAQIILHGNGSEEAVKERIKTALSFMSRVAKKRDGLTQ